MTFENPVQFEMKKLLRPKQMAGHLSIALLKKKPVESYNLNNKMNS